LRLRFQNWARIVVRSRLFCKAKTVILRDTTPEDFELGKPLFLLRKSDFRKAVGMLRLRCTEKLEDKLRGQGRSFLERLRALAAASPSGGRQDRQTQNSSASA
jgi:hypothetical protein